MKYVVLMIDGVESIFTFPRSIDHDRFVEGLQTIRFGHGQNWERKLRTSDVVAAGFITDGWCHGGSETLGIDSRGEIDTALISTMESAPSDWPEHVMQQWDYWRGQIAHGHRGSAPRDWFESLTDAFEVRERK